MRRSILMLVIWATPGLCSAGFCGTVVIDHDEHAWSTVAGASGWLALTAVWLGVSFLWSPARRAGVWCFVCGAALSWLALAVAIAVAVAVGRSAAWMTGLAILWIAVVWTVGVFPATLAAARSWRSSQDLSPGQ